MLQSESKHSLSARASGVRQLSPAPAAIGSARSADRRYPCMYVLVLHAMNRRQVAQRLGKSLATVRRIEGVLLHPARDARGVHQFDDKEVEGVAQGVENGTLTLWQEIRRGATAAATDDSLLDEKTSNCAVCVHLEKQVQALSDELNELRRRRRLDADDLETEKARFAAERREFEDEVAEFMAAAEALSQ